MKLSVLSACSSGFFSAIVAPATTGDGLPRIGGLRCMPTRELLSPAQRAQFLSIPAEMSEQMLARYHTLSSEDLVRIRRRRRSHNKLGFAVQLAYLRFPGRTWTASEEASPLIVSYIANQRHRSIRWGLCSMGLRGRPPGSSIWQNYKRRIVFASSPRATIASSLHGSCHSRSRLMLAPPWSEPSLRKCVIVRSSFLASRR